MRKKKKSYLKNLFTSTEQFDSTILLLVAILSAIGIIMIFSASSYISMMETKDADPTSYLRKQAISLAIGIVVMIVMMKFNYNKLKGILSLIAYCVSIFTVFLVKTSLGISKNGATRWIGLFGISFQPAEFVKFGVILILATMVANLSYKMEDWKNVIKMWMVAAFPTLLVLVLTKNLSSAIIVAGIAFLMSYAAHRKKNIFIISVALVALVAIAVIAYAIILDNSIDAAELAEHGSFRLGRILGWLNPEKYSTDESYQTLQALYAIGSGGFFGKGLGSSLQKLDFIPEASNDMIFSIICEELGLFGAVILLALFGLLLYRIALVAKRTNDLFGCMIAIGVFAQIAIQVVLNVAVVTNLIPNTGVSLPFVSYGGSSIMFLMAEMGIVMNISAASNRKVMFKNEEEHRG